MRNFKYLFILFFILASCLDSKESTKTLKFNKARVKTIYGDVLIKFYEEDAPQTVTRIKSLINSGFYNGLTFHRVIQNKLVQTGSPTGELFDGTGSTIINEENNHIFEIGTVAMARDESIKNSADSQFFISLSRLEELNGKYTIFGKVIEGAELLKKINVGDKIIQVSLE